MTMTITHKGRDFPTEPVIQTNLNLFGGYPNTNQYWIQYEGTDLIFMGRCIYCDNGLWKALDDSPIEFLDTQQRFDTVADPDEEGVLYRCDAYCKMRREGTILRDGRSLREDEGDWAPFEWPENIREIAQQMLEKVRAEQAKWLQAMPMEPAVNALVYLRGEGKVTYFLGWEDGKARVEGHDPVDPEHMFTMIPAIFGIMHDNLVSIPKAILSGTRQHGNELMKGAGNDPQELTATRWAYSSHHHTVTCKTMDGATTTFSADAVACFVPSVNPASENSDQLVQRLQFQLDRERYALHARLVAEGKARGWCETFDPILISQGLEPRNGKHTVSGTVSFSYTFDTSSIDESTLAGFLEGKRIHDYLPNSAFSDWKVTVEQPQNNRLLS